MHRDVRFSYIPDQGLYLARSESQSVFFSERMRGVWLYSRGIERRGEEIFQSYFLDQIHFSKDDIVIDCGANFADLYIQLSKIEPEIRYIAFEPSPQEYRCVQLNSKGEHLKQALFNQSGTMDLFVSSSGADSSLIKPKVNHSEVVSIETVTLNDFAADLGRIKLVKLEAEGVEPEILEGSTKVLSKIDYIAVDGGAERGMNEDSTIESLTNTLLSNDFELVKLDFSTGMGRALFRNSNFQETK